jgi:DNA-binding MarR family transcriptional regulator
MKQDRKLSTDGAGFDRSASAGYLTNWAARLYGRAVDRELKPLGLSSAHLPIFFALGGGEALTQKALAEAAAVEQPTMAATLARMERDGLIERRPHPDDRRSSLVSLTPGALSKRDAVRAAIGRVNEASLALLSSDEREAHLHNLTRIASALETSLGGA